MQLLFGLFLYFAKGYLYKWKQGAVMSDPGNRFFAMEHTLSMIIAIVLVHLGYNFAKRNLTDEKKFRRVFWCAFVALFIFVAMTPWQQGKNYRSRPNVPTMSAY